MMGTGRIGLRSLAGMCGRIGTSLAAGIDVRKVFESETRRGPIRQRAQIDVVSQAVNDGDGVAQALAMTGEYFPEIVHDLVEVGERSGNLAEVFSRLGSHYDHLLSLRRTFLVTIIWPAIQLAAAVVIVGVLIWVAGLISRMTGETVDFLGLGLIGTRGLLLYIVFVAVMGAVLFFMIRGLYRIGPVMRLAMNVPVVGACLRTMALSRMAWALSLAVESGMSARKSVQVAIRSTGNACFTSDLGQVDESIASGNEIHEALAATGAYPAEFVDVVAIGEQSGRLSEEMSRLSKQYQQRAEASSGALTTVAAFTTWGLVAMVLVVLIFRLALSYRDMIFHAVDGF